MTDFDLGIRCDYLLRMAGGKAQVERDQFLGIQGSRITKIAPWDSAPKGWHAKRMIQASDHVVMPGLINGHTHLPMTLFRGLADDLPFHRWIYDYILPLEGKLVDPDFVRAGTELAALECIAGGVTTVCDMYYYEDCVAEVIDRAGMRAILAEAMADFAAPDDKDKKGNGLRILARLRAKYQGHERILPAIGPHAPYTCSDETIRKVRDLADQQALPIVIHVSETRGEFDESLAKYKKTPVERLHDLGLMRAGTIFAHAVHVTDSDIGILADTKTSVIHNPESNMKLGSGAAPVPKLLSRGVAVGLGTDGSASNNDLNIFREMDTGAKLQKLIHADNTAMTASQMLSLATWSGARALGLGDQTGSLEEGKLADVILVSLRYPHMQPVHDIASQLVYAASGLEVDTVICHGRVLLDGRKVQTLDPERVFAEVTRFRDRIQENLPE